MGEWYKKSFGKDYLTVYRHRDFQGAYREVKALIGWLHLPRGSSILDLCCGMGRHSLSLTEYGYSLTGVDLSEALLQEARKQDTQHRVKWVQGDMRSVPLAQSFDAVVNLFTSFGYFDKDTENAEVFREICRLLKPGGLFIVDYLNPGYVKTHLVPYSIRSEGDLSIQEYRKIEDGFVRKKIVLREAGREDRVYMEQVRLYELTDFERMIAAAGLHLDAVRGSYQDTPYLPAESPRIIMTGHKPIE